MTAFDERSVGRADWEAVIDEAALAGARLVQFTGGEPTLHPDLPYLIRYALSTGIQVEVISNLVHVTPAMWKVFSLPGVRLATSYYSDDRAQHRQLTGRDTYSRTKANIAEAVRRGIRIRAGIIDVRDGQRTAQAEAELRALGVTSIGVDRIRHQTASRTIPAEHRCRLASGRYPAMRSRHSVLASMLGTHSDPNPVLGYPSADGSAGYVPSNLSVRVSYRNSGVP